MGFYRRYLTGYGVRAARAGQHAGNARFSRLFKASIESVDGIERSEVRCDGISHLVAVLALKGQRILGDADMCMGIDKAWIERRALGVISLALRAVFHIAQGDYFFIKLDISVFDSTVRYRMYNGVLIITRSLLFLKSKKRAERPPDNTFLLSAAAAPRIASAALRIGRSFQIGHFSSLICLNFAIISSKDWLPEVS